MVVGDESGSMVLWILHHRLYGLVELVIVGAKKQATCDSWSRIITTLTRVLHCREHTLLLKNHADPHRN